MTFPLPLPIADPELAAALSARLDLVEERLRGAVTHADLLADSASRHLVNAGGKRLRSLLTLLAAQLGEGQRPEVIDAAVVVELTHLATLYHDDVMDSAPVRRGAPTAHEVWGNSVAILTGDLLFARASRVVAGLGPEAVRIQAETFERLCLGQLHETVGPGAGDNAIEHYLQVLADKTGSLIATAARFGAMFAGCEPTVVELTHLATLYHDDVMDAAPMRRGAPTAHEVWGNSVAILTGDLLFARASRVVSGLGPEAVRIQAETFERLCLGQLHETVGPGAGDNAIEHYLQVLADKTGSLIATAARFGAMFAGCEPPVVAQVTSYGELAGVAFQLADDVIDVRSAAEVTGKTPGTDLRERVATMPVLLLRERVAAGAGAEDRALLAAIDGDLTSDARLAEVVAALGRHSVVDETSEKARSWGDEAIAAIAGLPAGEVKDALVAFADALVSRAG